jgi:hypothetical protein
MLGDGTGTSRADGQGNRLDRGNHRFAIVCPAYVIGKGLSARALEAYLVIALERITNTGRTRPLSVRTIANQLHLAEPRWVHRYIRDLIAVGAIERLDRGRGPGAASIYRVIGTDDLAGSDSLDRDRVGDRGNGLDQATGDKYVTGLGATGDKHVTGLGATGDTHVTGTGDTHVTAIRKNRTTDSVSDETAPDGSSGDPIKQMFSTAIDILTRYGIPEPRARTLVGKWRSQLRDDGRLLKLLLNVAKQHPVEPIAYINRAIDRAVQAQLGGGYRPMPSVAGG